VRRSRDEKSGAFGDTDQRPCRVENFDQDHNEHDVNDPSVQSTGEVKLHEGRRDGRRRRGNAAERADARQNGGARDEKNSDLNRARNPERVQRRDREETEDAEESARRGHVAERHVGGRVGDDQSRAFHRDERQEKSDARRDRAAHGMRDACDEPAPNPAKREDQEDHPGNEDGAERLLPTISKLPDDRECKALSPMPGAMAIGQFAQKPMTAEPIAAARQVATNTALPSIPVLERIFGLTKMM
jgi:hypothetical protein